MHLGLLDAHTYGCAYLQDGARSHAQIKIEDEIRARSLRCHGLFSYSRIASEPDPDVKLTDDHNKPTHQLSRLPNLHFGSRRACPEKAGNATPNPTLETVCFGVHAYIRMPFGRAHTFP